jgi:hypothetical protein
MSSSHQAVQSRGGQDRHQRTLDQLKKSQTMRFNNSVDQVKADKEVDTRTEEVEEEIRDTDHLRMTERNNSGVA